MIVGLGTDVLEVLRMKRELARPGGGFKKKVFTPAETAYCEKMRYPARHFAARFAAKEATFKALGASPRSGLSWQEVEVRRARSGAPRLEFHGEARRLAARRRVRRAFLSLAHTAGWAVASVVLES